MLNEFGAYYQCYKNPYATYKSLESFRKIYPDNTVVLVSNNGYDYTVMASYFKCIYIHSNENARQQYPLNDEGKFDNTFKFIDRVVNAFEQCNEDYVMWLEDDVSINKPIEDIFRYHLNGFCPNLIPQNSIKKLQEKYKCLDETKQYRYSGHGGSVFDRKFFIECMKQKEMIHDIIENWVYYDFQSGEIPQDILFSVIIMLSGGTIGSYEGHYDGIYNLNPNIHVQHQFKYYYNVPLPNELKYLVKDN
jgi:hypothetical protein